MNLARSPGTTWKGRSASLAVVFLAFPAAGRDLAGWLELARLEPEGITLSAKLDTGADSSSLGARDIRIVWSEHGATVRFRVQDPGRGGVVLQRPLVRTAKIKQHGAASDRRAVVRLRICLGGISKEVEVNLVDRSNYEHPLLIGRNFLAEDLLVDPAASFTRSPACRNGVAD